MALEKLTDQDIRALIKNKELKVPYKLKKQVKTWLTDQFNLLKPDWDNPNVELDSRLARKVVLLGIDKIYIADKDGNFDPKFVTNVSALLDQRGKLGFSSAKKQFQNFLKRALRISTQSRDKFAPPYNKTITALQKAVGHNIEFEGDIHHRFPVYVLGQIADRWEAIMHELAGTVWDGKKRLYSKQLIDLINRKFKIPTGDDIRNLDFIKKENLNLHKAVHKMWNDSGFSKEALPEILAKFKTPQELTEFITGPIADTLKKSEEMVDNVIPFFKGKTAGEIGKFWRTVKENKRKVISGSAISLASLTDMLSRGVIGAGVDVGLDEDVWGAVGRRQKAISEDDIIAQHLAEADIRKESYKAIIQGIVGSAVIGKLGAAKYLGNPLTAAPFITYAALESADAYVEGMGGKGWKERYANLLNYDEVREEGADYSDRKFVPRESKQEVRKELAGAVERIGKERADNPNNLDSLLTRIGL